MQDVIRPCQQEAAPLTNHVDGHIVAGWQCITPSLQRWMHMLEFSGANKKPLPPVHRHVNKGMWSDESSFDTFATSGRVHARRTKRTVQAWMLDPTVRESTGSENAVGGRSLDSPEGRTHCKSIRSCSEWLPLHFDETSLSRLKWSLPGWQHSHPQDTKGRTVILKKCFTAGKTACAYSWAANAVERESRGRRRGSSLLLKRWKTLTALMRDILWVGRCLVLARHPLWNRKLSGDWVVANNINKMMFFASF